MWICPADIADAELDAELNGAMTRRIHVDDACRSGHNLLTRMRETIVCVSADLPGDIAIEFYKSLHKS